MVRLFISSTDQYHDVDQRDALAGRVDTFVSGASHILYAFDANVYDGEMGTVSYSLGSPLITMAGRYELLKHELDRNPMETLILELSYDSTTRQDFYHIEGDMYLLPRLPTAGKKLSYFLTFFAPDEYDDAYSFAFSRGINAFLSDDPLSGNRGLFPSAEASNLQLTEEQIAVTLGKHVTPWEPVENNLYYLDKILQLCHEKGVRVIMITTPISQNAIITYSGLDRV